MAYVVACLICFHYCTGNLDPAFVASYEKALEKAAEKDYREAANATTGGRRVLQGAETAAATGSGGNATQSSASAAAGNSSSQAASSATSTSQS